MLKGSAQYPVDSWDISLDLPDVYDCPNLVVASYPGSCGGISLLSHQSPFRNQPPATACIHGSKILGQHCYTLARSTLDLVQQQQQPADSSPPTVEHILRNNQSATANVLRILDCSCAPEPHLALLSTVKHPRTMTDWTEKKARRE